MKLQALAILATFAATVHAQNVIEERTEVRPVTMTPIQAGTISVRDGAGMGAAAGGPVFGSGGTTVMQETEVRVLAFQIPDFNPQDLYTHHYHVGMFSESGNGSGTAYPNDEGYVEFEQQVFSGEVPMTTFLYSVHVDTSEVRVFMDVGPLTVNQAAMVLTNLALNGRAQRGERSFGPNQPRPRLIIPPPIGDQRTLSWSGDYLTLDDLQEQVYQQTGCDVAQVEGDYRYQVVGCD